MAKSSIHIQRAVDGSVGHNSREHFSYSVVFVDDGEQNECTHSVDEAYKIYRAELKKRTQAYEKRTGQKLQKSAVTQLSAIINLEKHHTLKDLKPIKKHLEKIFGTKVYQMAIHRDEGKLISKIDGTELYSGKDFFLNPENKKFYFDKQFTKEIDLKDYEIVKNYHAHIEMMGLDNDGYAIRQKMNKTVLKQMQTFVAKELKMERGKENISYSQEEMKQILAITGNKSDYESNTLFAKRFNEVAKELGIYKEKRKRQDTHIFKDVGAVREEAKREALKEVLATKEQLKEANNKLRAFMKENQAVRTDYAPLEAEKKILEEKLKAKLLTEKELLEKFQELEKKFINSKSLINELKTEKEDLSNKVTTLEEKIVSSSNMSDSELKKELQNIINDEIEVKSVKTGLFATEEAPVIKNSKSFLQKIQDLAIQGTQAVKQQFENLKREITQLKSFVKALQKENADLKEKVKQLESVSSTKQKDFDFEKLTKDVSVTKEKTQTIESDSSFQKNNSEKIEEKNKSKNRGREGR